MKVDSHLVHEPPVYEMKRGLCCMIIKMSFPALRLYTPNRMETVHTVVIQKVYLGKGGQVSRVVRCKEPPLLEPIKSVGSFSSGPVSTASTILTPRLLVETLWPNVLRGAGLGRNGISGRDTRADCTLISNARKLSPSDYICP